MHRLPAYKVNPDVIPASSLQHLPGTIEPNTALKLPDAATSSPVASGSHLAVHLTVELMHWDSSSSSLSNLDIGFAGQPGSSMGGWEEEMQMVSGTLSRALSSSFSASSMGSSASESPDQI